VRKAVLTLLSFQALTNLFSRSSFALIFMQTAGGWHRSERKSSARGAFAVSKSGEILRAGSLPGGQTPQALDLRVHLANAQELAEQKQQQNAGRRDDGEQR
jgi:hypothetical protein